MSRQPCVAAVFALLRHPGQHRRHLHLTFLESADPDTGIGLELSAIASSSAAQGLMGGSGVSHFLGVLIIAVLQSRLPQVSAARSRPSGS